MHTPIHPPAPPPVTKQDSRIMLRILREHVRPYTRWFVIGLIMMALVAGSTAMLARLMEPVLDDVFVEKDRQQLYSIALMVLAVFMVKSVATYAESMIMNTIGLKVVTDLQRRLYNHLLTADLALIQRYGSGNLMARFTSDCNLLRANVSSSVTSLGKDSLTLLFLVILMFYQDPLLACVSFFVFPAAFYPIVRLGKRMRKVTGVSQQEIGTITGMLAQTFMGIRTIKAYGQEAYENSRMHIAIERLLTLTLKANRIRCAAPPMMESIGGIAICVVILYGGMQVIEGAKTTGSFFSFITALLMAYEPIKKLSRLNTQMQEGVAAAYRLYEVLDVPAGIHSDANAIALHTRKADISFRNVHFSYNPETPVLQDITITAATGETIALVGASGCGKSTLINLLPRFYSPTQGQILINNQDITRFTLDSLRRHIALVSQEITLFDDTIYNNILYGNAAATEAEVIAAAKSAAAHPFIMELPQGYHTQIGELGGRLSGGQRQRIAIARAFLRDAPILLLDEATSALDSVAEREIQTTLNSLAIGKTTIMVAHRLSTIAHAHRIYVLDHGRIVEHGSHTELLAKNGAYANLYTTQQIGNRLIAEA